jgi:hypothetical protein
LNQVDQLASSKDYDKAIASGEVMIMSDPKNPEPVRHIGATRYFKPPTGLKDDGGAQEVTSPPRPGNYVKGGPKLKPADADMTLQRRLSFQNCADVPDKAGADVGRQGRFQLRAN